MALLCFVALLGTQALGGVRGYISECGGVQEWTVLDPCSAGGEEVPPHEQVREDVQIRLLPAVVAPEIVAVLVAELDDKFCAAVSRPAPSLDAAGVIEAGPPPGVAVARTVVLLI
jgi:hypothetical protein